MLEKPESANTWEASDVRLLRFTWGATGIGSCGKRAGSVGRAAVRLVGVLVWGHDDGVVDALRELGAPAVWVLAA